MSDDNTRIKNSRRRYSDQCAVERQLDIAKSHGVKHIYDKQPHRLSKHHALNCGNTRCMMCGNHRKLFGELTPQERRLFQDMDEPDHHHRNGLDRDK